MEKVTVKRENGETEIVVSGLQKEVVDLFKALWRYSELINPTSPVFWNERTMETYFLDALKLLEDKFLFSYLSEEDMVDITDGYLLEIRDDGSVVYEMAD